MSCCILSLKLRARDPHILAASTFSFPQSVLHLLGCQTCLSPHCCGLIRLGPRMLLSSVAIDGLRLDAGLGRFQLLSGSLEARLGIHDNGSRAVAINNGRSLHLELQRV